MLILSRKVNESIVIDGRIIVKVVRVEGDQIKLGIEAPRDVPVHRQEVFQEIVKTQRPTSPGHVPPDLRSSSAPPPASL